MELVALWPLTGFYGSVKPKQRFEVDELTAQVLIEQGSAKPYAAEPELQPEPEATAPIGDVEVDEPELESQPEATATESEPEPTEIGEAKEADASEDDKQDKPAQAADTKDDKPAKNRRTK